MKIFVNFIVAGPATHISCNRLAWFERCPLFITRPVDTMWQLWVQVYWSRDLSRSVSLLARRHADRGFLCGTKSSETVLFTRVGVKCFTGCITFSIVPFSLSPVYFLFTFPSFIIFFGWIKVAEETIFWVRQVYVKFEFILSASDREIAR